MKSLLDACPLWYKLGIILCAVLIIASFILPPVGIIDSSVLCAVGELGGFCFLGLLPVVAKIFKAGKEE